MAHLDAQALVEGLPEASAQTNVVVGDDFIRTAVMAYDVVDKVHGCLFRRVGRLGWDKTAHAGKAVDERQDAVERQRSVQHGWRGSSRPIHVEVLPGVSWCSDHLCFAPGCSLNCPVSLAGDAGQHEVVDVRPHSLPVVSFLNAGRRLVPAAVSRESGVMQTAQDLQSILGAWHAEAVAVESGFEEQIASYEITLSRESMAVAPQALPPWCGVVKSRDLFLVGTPEVEELRGIHPFVLQLDQPRRSDGVRL